MSQRTSLVLYRVGISANWIGLNFAQGTPFACVRCVISNETGIPVPALVLVFMNQYGQFCYVADHEVVVNSISVYAATINQFLLVFGDLEMSILARFEEALGINGIVRGCHNVVDTFYPGGCIIKRRTVCMPSAVTLCHELRLLFQSARYTEYVILCHSIDAKGLLIGGKLINVRDFAGISPIDQPFNAIPNAQTCFAPNNIYLEAVASGRDQQALLAMEQIIRGAPSGILLVSDAIRSVINGLRYFGCNVQAQYSTFWTYPQTDYLFLSKWGWPHTTDVNQHGQRVRVKEQFGETFHFAVLVAVFPCLMYKLLKPNPTVNMPACPNDEQYNYFEAVACTAYSYQNASLITPCMQQIFTATTLYTHSVGTELMAQAGKEGQFICAGIAVRIKRRLLNIRPLERRTRYENCGSPRCVVLAVRKSSTATDTNSAVRDTPDSFIKLFLNTYKNVVVVGNRTDTIRRDFRSRSDIHWYPELWTDCPRGENKFLWQMWQYQQIFERHNACHAIGMWSGQLDMYALLGMSVLRIALKESYIARIREWSRSVGLPFHVYPCLTSLERTDEQDAILKDFDKLVQSAACDILYNY
jgi:hypothetical protein